MIDWRSREAASLLTFSALLGTVSLSLSFSSGFLLTHLSSVSLSQTGLMLSLLCGFVLGVGLLSYYHERTLLGFQLKHVHTDLTEISAHLLALPPESTSAFTPGALAQQLADRSQGIVTCINALSDSIFAGLSVIGLMLMFLWVSSSQLFMVLPLILLSLAFKWVLLNRRLSINDAQLNTQLNLANWLTEVVLSITKIRLSHATPDIFKRGMAYLRQLKAYMQTLTRLQMAMTTLDALFSLALTLLVMHEANFKSLALLLMVGQLSAMLDRLSSALIQYQQGKQACARLQSVLALPTPVTRFKIKTIPAEADLCFEQVSYQPTSSTSPLVEHIDFSLKYGEFAALTGPSGSGKSTVLRLALGLISPTRGRITLNGIDLHHYDLSAWYRAAGTILQTTQLMSGSLYQNIAGHSGISLDEAWAVAEVVGLADDIRAMPMGMQTRISHQAGASLSGGQRQKCLLARVLAQKPRWLFLDEATSALDNISQARLQMYLNDSHMTRLVVAHRLCSVQHADRMFQFNSSKALVEVPDFHALNSYSIPQVQSA